MIKQSYMNMLVRGIMKIVLGFTLTELLVVIAIIGILGSIAYPSYLSYMLKARRGDAKVELLKAQLKQTSLRILNPSYSDDENVLGLINSAYYDFTIAQATATTYLIKAVAKATQTKDVDCQILTINQNSNKTPDSCW